MKTRTVELKIKIKSLAEESRIIRHEELKARGAANYLKTRQGHEATAASQSDLRSSLYHHRVNVVRPEARASQLAQALLRGRKAYREVEAKCYREPDWANVARLVSSFVGLGIREAETMVKGWREAGNSVAA